MTRKAKSQAKAIQPQYSPGRLFVFGGELDGFLRVVDSDKAIEFCTPCFYNAEGTPIKEISTSPKTGGDYPLEVSQGVLDDFNGYKGEFLEKKKVREPLNTQRFRSRFATGQYVLFKMLNPSPAHNFSRVPEESYVLCSVGRGGQIHWPNQRYGPLGRFSAVSLEERIQKVLERLKDQKAKPNNLDLTGISPEEALVIWAYEQGLDMANKRARIEMEKDAQGTDTRVSQFFYCRP
ncbi:MAG: hypothetical protein NTX24_02540 [Candidatus Pacearchaeota archaeon]|nr:hypothetical protein [Candidatus Pacearchaeota archaeon]